MVAAFVHVTVRNPGGDIVFGPEQISSHVTVKELKRRFEAERKKSLLLLSTFEALLDCRTLADSGLCSEADLVVRYLREYDDVDDGVEAMSAPKRMRWEQNLQDLLFVGERFGGSDSDEYVLEKELGRGGQAQVFRCRRCCDDVKVTVQFTFDDKHAVGFTSAGNEMFRFALCDMEKPLTAGDLERKIHQHMSNAIEGGSIVFSGASPLTCTDVVSEQNAITAEVTTFRGKLFAVKVYRKSKLLSNANDSTHVGVSRDYAYFKQEVQALKDLSHPNILRAKEVLETSLHFFIVTELGQGDLQTIIEEGGPLNEHEARHVFSQLLNGVNYMHSRGVLHRDLKLSNIIARSMRVEDGVGRLFDVIICDFGLSKKIVNCAAELSGSVAPDADIVMDGPGPTELIHSAPTTPLGTRHYVDPNVINQARIARNAAYDKEVDYWSLGMCLYFMLAGLGMENEIAAYFCGMSQLSPAKYEARVEEFLFNGRAWETLPLGPKDLISGLLHCSVEERFGFNECFGHDWVKAST